MADEAGPDPTRELDPVELAAWRALVVGSGRLMRKLDEQLQAEASLNLADYEVLSYLSEVPGHRLRMAELAAGVVISRSGLTRRVDNLVRMGLVRRCACGSDRRGTYAELTEAGLKRLLAVVPVHRAGVRKYFLDKVQEGDLGAIGRAMGAIAAELGMWPVGEAAFR